MKKTDELKKESRINLVNILKSKDNNTYYKIWHDVNKELKEKLKRNKF